MLAFRGVVHPQRLIVLIWDWILRRFDLSTFLLGCAAHVGAIIGGAYGITQLSTNRPSVQIDSRRVQINQFLNTTGDF